MAERMPIVAWGICLLVFVFGGLGRVQTVSSGAATDLIITEIMYNPAYEPSSQEQIWEWIELYNSGSGTIDLSGFVLDDAKDSQLSSSNIAAGSIGAGQSVILYNGDAVSADAFRQAWGDVDLVSVTNWSKIRLANGGESLALWSSFEDYDGDHVTQENVIEQVQYYSFVQIDGWPDSQNGKSIFLKSLTADNTVGSNWASSTVGGSTPLYVGYQSIGASGNSGLDIGSPGQPPVPPTPTSTQTATATSTQTATATSTQTATATSTQTATATSTQTATATSTQTATATSTQTATATSTQTATATSTQTATATSTQMATATSTQTATATSTQTATATSTATSTQIATATSTQIATATSTQTATATSTQTATPVLLATFTPIPLPTGTPPFSITVTPTLFPTATPTYPPTESAQLGPVVSIKNVSLSETNEVTSTMSFEVSLSEPITASLTIGYITRDGSAKAGEDYVATAGALTIPAGAQFGFIEVVILGDEIGEPDETFDLILLLPVDIGLDVPASQTIGVGRIQNDDQIKIYLPTIFEIEHVDPVQSGVPDLIIDRIGVRDGEVIVVVKNIGDGPVTSAFWLDLFVNPQKDPVSLNDTLELLGEKGYVWGITKGALPILAGGEVALKVNDRYFSNRYSNYAGSLSAGDRLVTNIDSATTLTTFGAVFESREDNNVSAFILGDSVSVQIGSETLMRGSQVYIYDLPHRIRKDLMKKGFPS